MSEEACKELYGLIVDETPIHFIVRRRQLGNGEWVVIVGKQDFFCWSQADWQKYPWRI